MQAKTTYFPSLSLLRSGGRLLDFSTPRIMGILNITPDSFFDGGKIKTTDDALRAVEQMLQHGADIIDVGGMSTRPGAEIIDVETELQRVIPVIEHLKKTFPDIWISVDTIHARVAEYAVNAGADIINDVSAGELDIQLLETVSALQVPYILTHMQGVPQTMQEKPVYENVVQDVFRFFIQKLHALHQLHIYDVIIDPGFGFGKSLQNNYALAAAIDQFQILGKPLLAGISRKSMICKLLQVNPENALNGTTALHALLLLKGVNLLRVHDVKEAAQVMQIVKALQNAQA